MSTLEENLKFSAKVAANQNAGSVIREFLVLKIYAHSASIVGEF
jgi:hypothetical protein